MSRSEKRSLTIPVPVRAGLRLQLDRSVPDYPSENACWIGLARYQLLYGGPHPITSAIARFHPQDQDLIDDFLLELNERGLALRGQFMRHIAERVVGGLPEPNPEEIVRLQATEILGVAKRWKDGNDVWKEYY